MQTDIQASLNVMKTDIQILTVVGLLIAATSILGFVLTTLN